MGTKTPTVITIDGKEYTAAYSKGEVVYYINDGVTEGIIDGLALYPNKHITGPDAPEHVIGYSMTDGRALSGDMIFPTPEAACLDLADEYHKKVAAQRVADQKKLDDIKEAKRRAEKKPADTGADVCHPVAAESDDDDDEDETSF